MTLYVRRHSKDDWLVTEVTAAGLCIERLSYVSAIKVQLPLYFEIERALKLRILSVVGYNGSISTEVLVFDTRHRSHFIASVYSVSCQTMGTLYEHCSGFDYFKSKAI